MPEVSFPLSEAGERQVYQLFKDSKNSTLVNRKAAAVAALESLKVRREQQEKTPPG